MSRRIPWQHVAHLPPIQSNRNSQMRARIVQSEQGYGVEFRIAPHHAEAEAFGDNLPSLVIYGDAIPQAMAVLSEAHAGIVKLKRSGR
jgi:hypothetical protein